ncbi:MAG: PPC domain-containing DNA-binding protein [Candidatus Angelobacter sp.]
MKAKLLHEVEGLKTYALVFSTGEPVNEQLLGFAQQNDIKAAQLTAIGAFNEVTLGYFSWTSKRYEEIPIPEQVELVALNGNLSLSDGKPKLHAHVVVGKQDGSAWAGHLLRATVRPTLEVMLVETPAYLRRVLDKETGLPLLDLAA